MKQNLYVFIIVLLLYSSVSAEELRLQNAIEEALLHNHKQAISLQERAIAQAKYKASLSVNLPSLDILLVANRRDEPLVDKTNTLFNIEGFGTFPVNYEHEVMGRDTLSAKAQLSYALYTGGKASAYQAMAKSALAYTKEEASLTAETIVLNVRKYYAALLLAQKLETLMQKSVEKMRLIAELTELFYKGASLKVKKTDYLHVKTTLLNMESLLLSFENATELARDALCLEMGRGAECSVDVLEESLDLESKEASLQEYYEKLFIRNHQLKKSKIALDAQAAELQAAKSEYMPKVLLYADIETLYNDGNGGIINGQNNDSWNIGAVVRYNLFNGGKSEAKLEELQAKKLKLKAQRAYLKSGLQLQAKRAYSGLQTAKRQVLVMREALKSATQNSDLNMRAYQEELLETKDVLEAEFMRSLTAAALYKAEYTVRLKRAELDYVIGKALR